MDNRLAKRRVCRAVLSTAIVAAIALGGAGSTAAAANSASEAAQVKTINAKAFHNVALGPSTRVLYITAGVDVNHAPYPGKVYRARLP